MPLTHRVTFKRPIENSNKIQVPKLIRWQFKLEPNQVLHVGICGFGRGWEFFYARMGKDGRIYIPKATMFAATRKNEENSKGYLIDVTLEPA
ncbi:MAG TPA: hypothetical protein VLU95_09030 [Candidatus Acidoferrum sp.]|nr:hypothetical protein [Candidatus Acidoferrum sp.]